jgi:hypothetical protein
MPKKRRQWRRKRFLSVIETGYAAQPRFAAEKWSVSEGCSAAFAIFLNGANVEKVFSNA